MALQPDKFQEGSEMVYHLPDCSEQAFNLFGRWLISEHRKPNAAFAEAEAAFASQLSGVQLWCFGDRFLIPVLQNHAMLILTTLLMDEERSNPFDSDALRYAVVWWDEKSPLQRFLYMIATTDILGGFYPDKLDLTCLPVPILRRLLREMNEYADLDFASSMQSSGRRSYTVTNDNVCLEFESGRYFVESPSIKHEERESKKKTAG